MVVKEVVVELMGMVVESGIHDVGNRRYKASVVGRNCVSEKLKC
jgi:hypothetical protein